MGTHPIFESDFDCLTEMTAFLPPNLIALFAPRDAIEFKLPVDDLPWERDRTKHPYGGIAQFVSDFDQNTRMSNVIHEIVNTIAIQYRLACLNYASQRFRTFFLTIF